MSIKSLKAVNHCLAHFHRGCRKDTIDSLFGIQPQSGLLPTIPPCADECTCYHASTTSTSRSPPESLRTRRPFFIPRFIVRFTSPPRRLRLPTKRRRRIPTELRSRRSSNRRRRTAREPIARVCRRRRRSREVFARCWRIIRSRVLRSRVGRSGCAAVGGIVSGRAGGKGVVCVRGGRGGGIPGGGSASSPRSTTVGCGATIGIDGAAAVRVGVYGSRAISAGVVSRCATTTIGGHGVLAPHGGSGRGDVSGPSRGWEMSVG